MTQESMHKFWRMIGAALVAASCLSVFAMPSGDAAIPGNGDAAPIVGIAARSAPVDFGSFPRLAAISYTGTYTSSILQDKLSHFGIVILGTQEPIPEVTSGFKRRNPKVLLGAYTVLNEARRVSETPLLKERTDKLNREGWWLQKGNGEAVRWTSDFGTWDINVSSWTKPDENGDRYPEWAAKFWNRRIFSRNADFDIWFFDNVFLKQRVKVADWQRVNRDQSGDDPDIQREFRAGQAREVAVARRLAPNALLVANADNDLSSIEYKGIFNGGLMECLVGLPWSIDTYAGWEKMIARYRIVTENLALPKLTIFGACLTDVKDYKLLRYAFGSSLLGDAFFEVTPVKNKIQNYEEWPWYDEFDIKLGRPIDSAFPAADVAGFYVRRLRMGR